MFIQMKYIYTMEILYLLFNSIKNVERKIIENKFLKLLTAIFFWW